MEAILEGLRPENVVTAQSGSEALRRLHHPGLRRHLCSDVAMHDMGRVPRRSAHPQRSEPSHPDNLHNRFRRDARHQGYAWGAGDYTCSGGPRRDADQGGRVRGTCLTRISRALKRPGTRKASTSDSREGRPRRRRGRHRRSAFLAEGRQHLNNSLDYLERSLHAAPGL